jgi:magnesium transporter
LSLPWSRATSTQRLATGQDTRLVDSALDTKNGKITCVYFDKFGRVDSRHKEKPLQLTKAEIAAQFELRHRDLRDIDLRSEGVTRILVRPSTILLQFFQLCMIVQADEALLINNAAAVETHADPNEEDDDVAATAAATTDKENDPELEQARARQQREQFYNDFEQRMSTPTAESADIPELPYELRAVEAALVAVLSSLRGDFVTARQRAQDAARSLRLDSGAGSIGLDRVFERTQALSKIEQKARLVRDTIRDVLDADDDLAGMYLTDRLAGNPHDVSDHQEAEYMLEAYHKAADTLVEAAQAVIDVLRKKENTFRSSLAVQRNQIMFLEARIAIHTLGLAAGTLVAGLFGMNLVNYLEEAPYGFFYITGTCIVLSSLFSMYGMRSYWRIQSLKGIQRSKAGGRERARARRRRGWW